MRTLRPQEEVVKEIKEIKELVGVKLVDLSFFIRSEYNQRISIATISRILNDKQVDINYKTLYYLSKALMKLENQKRKKFLAVKSNSR